MPACLPLTHGRQSRRRFVGRASLPVLLAIFPQMRASAADHDLGALVGTWHLVRYVDTPEGGTPVQPFGNSPAGLFLFTADGNVSISIMRNPPEITAATTDPDPDACIPGWYCSCFGRTRWTISAAFGLPTLLVETYAPYLGTDQPGSFTIAHDTLTIAETYMQGG